MCGGYITQRTRLEQHLVSKTPNIFLAKALDIENLACQKRSGITGFLTAVPKMLQPGEFLPSESLFCWPQDTWGKEGRDFLELEDQMNTNATECGDFCS